MGDFGAGLAQGAAGSTAQAVDRNSQQKLVRDKSAQDALLTREMAAENAALQRELEKSRAENAMALERMRGESARTLQRDSLDVNKPLVDANVGNIQANTEATRSLLPGQMERNRAEIESIQAGANLTKSQVDRIKQLLPHEAENLRIGVVLSQAQADKLNADVAEAKQTLASRMKVAESNAAAETSRASTAATEAEIAKGELDYKRSALPSRVATDKAQADLLGAQAENLRETTKGMVSERPLSQKERELNIAAKEQSMKFAATMHDFGVKGAEQGLKQGDLAIRQLERTLARAAVVEDMEDRKTAISLALTSSEAAKQMMADALAPLGLDPESVRAKEEKIFAVTMAVMQNPVLQQALTSGQGGAQVSAIMAAMRNELTDTVAGSMSLDENLQGEIATSTDLVRTLLVGGDVAAATAETARMAKKLDGVTGARKQEVEGAKVQRKLLERQNAPMPNWGPEAQRQYGTWSAWDAERKRRAGR